MTQLQQAPGTENPSSPTLADLGVPAERLRVVYAVFAQARRRRLLKAIAAARQGGQAHQP